MGCAYTKLSGVGQSPGRRVTRTNSTKLSPTWMLCHMCDPSLCFPTCMFHNNDNINKILKINKHKNHTMCAAAAMYHSIWLSVNCISRSTQNNHEKCGTCSMHKPATQCLLSLLTRIVSLCFCAAVSTV